MIIENITQIWDPILSQKSKFVNNFGSKETIRIIENLTDTMRNANLIWMAAGQIWEKLRIFVTEVRKTPFRNPIDIDQLRVYINPEIIYYSKSECVIYESCGSVAYWKLFWPVKRPKTIIIQAYDQNWQMFKLKAKWLLARVIQHEYDHLNGIEYTQKITDMRKIMSSEEYVKRVLNKKK